MNGAELMLKCLNEENVQIIFGYPGAAIAPLYDAMGKQSDIRHILVRHEQNAGHAASGYARASGKPGVCCTTSGPGALNLLTALATAYMDSIPMVAITGQVPTDMLGRDVFQEADTTGACEPFTKYSYLVKNVNDIPRIVREAFYIASSGRPGPVLIDLPVDVQQALYIQPFEYPQSVDIPGYKPRTSGHPLQIKRAVEAISRAERPLICAGGGVVSAKARKELVAFAEKLDIPVVTTLMGVGMMPKGHRLCLGMMGSHGSEAANKAAAKTDLLILCGARVGDRTLARPGQIAVHARIVHIDVDPVEIGKNMPANIPIVGDVRLVLRELAASSEKAEHTEWVEKTQSWRQDSEISAPQSENGIEPNSFMRLLSSKISEKGKAIVAADVGQNQIWAANSLALSGGRFLTSGGMGTMGYSIPAAIGAKLAKPSRTVVAVCGDGSFQMMLPELATIAQNGISVKIVVMRNGCLGMIKEIQDKDYSARHFSINLDGLPDISALAAAYGIKSAKVSSNDEAEAAISAMISSRGAYILDCVVDSEARSVEGRV